MLCTLTHQEVPSVFRLDINELPVYSMDQHLQGLELAKEYGAKQQQKKPSPILSQSLKSNLRSVFYIKLEVQFLKPSFVTDQVCVIRSKRSLHPMHAVCYTASGLPSL